MNKFMKDLEKELKKLNVSPKEIKEILEDHKEMIEAAKQEGLSDDEISLKFGDPVKVATELHDDSVNDESKGNIDDLENFTFVKGFKAVNKGLVYNISLINDDLILKDYDGEEIKVYAQNVKELDKYEISLDNKEFILKRETSKRLFFKVSVFVDTGTFLVLIPKGLKSEEFNYHTISGDVTISQLNVEKFKLKSTNGDIKLSNVDLGKTKLGMVNGDVEIKGLKASSFDISLVNGDITIIKGMIDENIQLNTVNGDVEFKETECDTAYFKTVSGDVSGENFYVNEVTYKSVSGDLVINNDDKTREIKVKSKKTVSGEVKIN